MKTNLYRLNDGSRQARRRLFATTLLVLLIYLIDLSTGGFLRAAVRSVGVSLSGFGSGAVSAISSTGFFATRASLESKIRSLSDEVSRLEEKSAGYSVLKAENDRLRELLKVVKDDTGITAPMISSLRSSPYGTFLIGAGNEDGVSNGDLVISAGGFVIGTVTDVRKKRSLVSQTFSPQSSLEAVVAGSAVSVEGRGGGNAYAKLPHGLSVEVGDDVIAPGFGSRPIGIVGSVSSSSASAYSDVFIGLPISIESLQYVYVVKPQ